MYQDFDWYHANGKNQSKTTIYFSPIYPNLRIKQPLVSAWVNEDAKWQKEWVHTGGGAHVTKWVCQTQHPEATNVGALGVKGNGRQSSHHW